MRIPVQLPASLALILLLATHPAVAADYKEGQVWRYKTRPGEENSRLYIVKIEDAKGLRIYHISLDSLRIANSRAASGFSERIAHLPVSATTLDQSVTEMVGIASALPDISEGYKIWKDAFDRGKAGVFTISVAEIVGVIEQVGRQSQ